MKKALFLALLLLFPLFVLAATSFPAPAGHVNDFAEMLTLQTRQNIEEVLTQFESETGHELAVVTISALGSDQTIETYANELFQAWGIGKKGKDDGLLLLISRDDREMRIETGYGLEGAVPDIEAGHVISDVLVPNFQAEHYDEGVLNAVDRLIEDIRNGAPAEPVNPPVVDGIIRVGNLLPFILFFLIFLSSILSRSKSWWAGGIVGAVVGWIFFSGLLWIVPLVVLGLLFDYIVSKTYKNSKARGINPPWWIGGPPRGGGGFGGGGGGFGGFGGGSSGSGGASGRW